MDNELDTILKCLEALRLELDCDEIKVYFIKEKDYCVKFIKNDKIQQVVRRGFRRK